MTLPQLLSRFLRRGLAAGFACIALCASAQTNLEIDAAAKYGVTYDDGTRTVAQKWAQGTDTLTLKWAWTRWKAQGMPYTTFRSRYVFTAVLKDIAWTNEAPNNLKTGYQNAYIKGYLPKGKFLTNATMQIPRGGLVGEGEFVYDGQGADHGQVATEVVMDDATWWPTSATERRVFETPNADRADNYAYNECFDITSIRLTGPRKKGDGITRIGWYIKRPGSTTWINKVQANGFNKGFVNIDGVPVVYGTIRAFECDIAGWSGEGTWGADITILKLETDGCGRSFQLIPSAEGNAGGTLRIGLKVEDGITSGIASPGTIAGWLEGQYSVEVFGNFSYENGVKPSDHLFVVKPTIGNGANQASLLVVQGKGFGYGSKLLRNLVTGSTWTGAGDYAAFRFEHYANGDKLTTGCPTITTGPGGTTPPPTTCTWILATPGAWSTCSNGTQNRTTSYTSSVAGCTPTGTRPGDQVEVQVCGTTPPATGALFTQSNLTNTDPAKLTPMNVPGVKRVVFTGIKWTKTGTNSYPYLLGLLNDQGVQATPTGSIVSWPWTLGITASGPLVSGSSVNITVTFTNPVTVTSLFNRASSRDAFQGTIGKMELFAQ